MSTITQWEGVFTHVDENGNKQQMFPEIKTDSTLTLGGKAADAAATGAMIKKATPVKILKADFEALTEEQKSTGSYLITDAGLEFPEAGGGSGASTAAELSYDGSVTGLGSNVQDAIDNVQKVVETNTGNISTMNSNLNSMQELLTSLNTTVKYIEENLGALSTEEYTCSGSVTLTNLYGGTVSQAITFNRIFVEPPAVSVSMQTNSSGRWSNAQASSITTSGCTISAYHDSDSRATSTIAWTAIGLVRKQL